MKPRNGLTLKILCLLFTLLLCGCPSSDSGSDYVGTETGNPGQIESVAYNVNGVVQKGPFIQGSSITIQELNEAFSPTGNTYNTTTTDDFGTFSISADLTSPYVEIIAQGYYFNEVSGFLSFSVLTLRALADLSINEDVNVNVLTTLESERVKQLMLTEEKTFLQAKREAEAEILDLFNISEDDVENLTIFDRMDISQAGESNAVLLALSAILQGSNSVAELSELISKISQDIKEDGTLDDPFYIEELRNNAMALDLPAVRTNLTDRYEYLGLNVTIPEFENYVDSDGDGIINRYEISLLSPSGIISVTKPTLEWEASLLPNVAYHVQLSSDSSFTSIAEEAVGVTGSTYTVSSAALDHLATYFWRVALIDMNGIERGWSDPFSFTVDLDSVTLVAPADTVLINDTTPVFSWNANPHAMTYTFQLSTAADLSNPHVLQSGIDQVNYDLTTALSPADSTVYYWSVIPVDGNGVSGTPSEIRSFTLDTVPPAGTIAMNNGDMETSSETVELTISATDGNAVTEMIFSKDGSFTDGVWENYTTIKQITFSGSEDDETATFTASVKFKDEAGNISAPFSDEISLKRTFKGGTLSANETWTIAESPYVIREDLDLWTTSALTIEPGVEIKYEGVTTMRLYGSVTAAGTEENPIQITYNGLDPLAEANTLIIEVNGLLDPQLNYIRIENADISLWTLIPFNTSADVSIISDHIEILDSRFELAGFGIITQFVLTNMKMDSSFFTVRDLSIDPVEITAGSITNSTLNSDTSSGVTLGNTTLLNSQLKLVSQDAVLRLEDSSYRDGLVDGAESLDVFGPIEIDRTELTNVRIDLPSVEAMITDTIFAYDSSFAGTESLRLGNGRISHSIINGNSTGTSLVVTGRGSSLYSDHPFTISLSDIWNNTIGILLAGNSDDFTISNCNIYDHSLYHIENRSPNNATATINYWGTTVVSEIDAQLFDKNDNTNYGFVYYKLPHLSDPQSDTGPR